ncbi:YitT family protein [Acinetobacter sp. ME22]|uniref:YitT family protein n=1 Tax=Acinetobacter sp. ME22 TaxID=2904802 RepID=UPI001EDC4F24|nr:YitT family protein [Acinetobacter sp. ME22]MCG2574479.1 YitT family protein [Acinetobacter sp. ME22]
MSNTTSMINYQPEVQLKPHSSVEDGLAMLIATFMISFAMLLMQSAGTLTGGTAGLALLIHYVTGIKFGFIFFTLNLPFYYLAYKQLGLQMVIKTFIAVGLLSVLTEIHPLFIHVQGMSPLYMAILANIFMGLGFLILFRHRSSLGGFNLLALFIQKRYGIPAGKIQMGLDICILLASLAYVNTKLLAISILGAVILNMILTLNHRSDRYVA